MAAMAALGAAGRRPARKRRRSDGGPAAAAVEFFDGMGAGATRVVARPRAATAGAAAIAAGLSSARAALPVTAHLAEIARVLGERAALVVVGETGSGKTTREWPRRVDWRGCLARVQ